MRTDMSTVAAAVERRRRAHVGLAAIFEHTRYVLGENRVTGFAFGLLIVIVFAALLGPCIVPLRSAGDATPRRR